MSDAHKDYWQEGIANAAEECGATLTKEQVDYIADAVQGAHENYGMAFYSPPPSDRIAVIESEKDAKIKALRAELESYRNNAESAMKRALRIHPDAQLSITEDGGAETYGGRTTRVL